MDKRDDFNDDQAFDHQSALNEQRALAGASDSTTGGYESDLDLEPLKADGFDGAAYAPAERINGGEAPTEDQAASSVVGSADNTDVGAAHSGPSSRPDYDLRYAAADDSAESDADNRRGTAAGSSGSTSADTYGRHSPAQPNTVDSDDLIAGAGIAGAGAAGVGAAGYGMAAAAEQRGPGAHEAAASYSADSAGDTATGSGAGENAAASANGHYAVNYDAPDRAERRTRHHAAGAPTAGYGAAAAAVTGAAAAAGAGSVAGAEASGAAGAGAAGAAGTGTPAGGSAGADADLFAGEGSVAAEAGAATGVPLRGIAMILAAVAVALIGYGIYAMTNGDSDNDTNASSNSADTNGANETAGGHSSNSDNSAQGTNGANNNGAEGTAAGNAANGQNSHEAHANDADRAEGQAPGAERDAAAGAEGAANAPARNGAPVTVDKKRTSISVLNNSTVTGWASRTAGELGQKQWSTTNEGNLPTNRGSDLPSSTVFYRDDASRPAAEAVARDLGLPAPQKLDGEPARLMDGATIPGPELGNVIVVLAGQPQ